MPSPSSLRGRLRATLFWLVIAAAFVGPGTVTTAASVGAGTGLSLLWVLLFAVAATMVLQEASARVTQASGLNLGQILAHRFAQGSGALRWLLFGAIALGCAAYEAGNLLGALVGIRQFFDASSHWAILMAAVAAALLWSGNYQRITTTLGVVVALMGLVFAWVAWHTPTSGHQWLAGLAPHLPSGSTWLAIALVGTTIVPYNLFLASGLRHQQGLSDMRWGLALSIAIGGAITLAIVVAGTAVEGEFSYSLLSAAVAQHAGAVGPACFGLGLFAAGFTSAITAPLAAAVTAQSLFGHEEGAAQWQGRSARFRLVWGGVLAFGLLFAWLDVRPIPAIIAAQIVNGLILPLAVAAVWLAVNDRQLLPHEAVNGRLANLATALVLALCSFLAFHQLWNVLEKTVPPAAHWLPEEHIRLAINVILALVVAGLTGWQVRAQLKRG